MVGRASKRVKTTDGSAVALPPDKDSEVLAPDIASSADVATSKDGYKYTIVAPRAPVMSKTRVKAYQADGHNKDWKQLLLREKEEFFDIHWGEDQIDKPGSLPWAVSLRPEDQSVEDWTQLVKANEDGEYYTRQERAEVFDNYHISKKLPNPWYLPGAGGAPVAEVPAAGTENLQEALAVATAKKDGTKHHRFRLGAPTAFTQKNITQAEINKNFERMLPNLSSYLPYFEKTTHTKITVLMETKADHGFRAGRGKRSKGPVQTRFYAITGSLDGDSNPSETLQSRIAKFSEVWDGGKPLADEEREAGLQDRTEMVLVPPPPPERKPPKSKATPKNAAANDNAPPPPPTTKEGPPPAAPVAEINHEEDKNMVPIAAPPPPSVPPVAAAKK